MVQGIKWLQSQKVNMIEVHVTPSGIADWETHKFPPMTWEGAGQLLERCKEEDIGLQPHDNFTKSKFPNEYKILEDLIDRSNGKIKWQTEPGN
jgi:hypothetical protein